MGVSCSQESYSFISPISAPATPLPRATATLPIPTPEPGKGVIHGTLVSPSLNEIWSIGNLYLGGEFKVNDSLSFTRLIPSGDPKATEFAADGTFIFTNISPGTYNLVLWDDSAVRSVLTLDSSNYISVTVEAGDVIDLGPVFLP